MHALQNSFALIVHVPRYTRFRYPARVQWSEIPPSSPLGRCSSPQGTVTNKVSALKPQYEMYLGANSGREASRRVCTGRTHENVEQCSLFRLIHRHHQRALLCHLRVHTRPLQKVTMTTKVAVFWRSIWTASSQLGPFLRHDEIRL
jgi:hypothetical protein